MTALLLNHDGTYERRAVPTATLRITAPMRVVSGNSITITNREWVLTGKITDAAGTEALLYEEFHAPSTETIRGPL